MLSVVKIGGNVIDSDAALADFLADFAALPQPKILVHGGGKLATRLSEKLGIPTTMIDGRRVTDAETLQVAAMVYAGWINKRIVAQLQALGCNAIGLSGADANAIPATRRSPIPIDFGFVGDINPQQVGAKAIRHLTDGGFTPVFCAITHDGKGTLLNSNADTVASSLAMAMANLCPTQLIFCFEKDGVLANPDDDSSVIPTITPDTYRELKEAGVVSKGMIPKLDSSFKAIEGGLKQVVIKHAKNLGNALGTTIKSN